MKGRIMKTKNNNSPSWFSKFRAFLKGMGSVLDLSPTISSPYSHTKDGAKADAEALRKDFEVIGKDLGKAINDFKIK